jgi:nucleotide-binding universal stress UspA family protein
MQRSIGSSGQTGEPFKRIVVGVDDHQGGPDAVALAKELLARDGSLTLAHVYIREALIGRNWSPTAEPAEFPDGLRSRGADRDENWDGAPLRRVDSPSVGRGLRDLADAERADLLVVGSCRRGLLGRVMLGDDTSASINGAPCAIAIAPFGYAERASGLAGEIGVAYNGSPESDDALAVARALAANHGARLSAFQAVMVPSHLAVPGAGAVVDSLPELVDQARARIAAVGGVEPHAAYGVPAEELALYSASLDLLVVGSRGYGAFGRLMHGSTSRELARTARCPVLVLTRNTPLPPRIDSNHSIREATPAGVS